MSLRNPQSAIRNPLSICALLAALLLCSLATRAQDQEIANDEGPYLEGVFAREAGPPLILPAKLPEYEPAPLFDEEGNSNSVIVLLDFDAPAFDPVLSGKVDPGDQLAAEQAMLETINAREQATEALFSQPDEAHFLIRPENRLDPQAREALGTDNPRERLERYLVLRYSSVKAAKAAETYLKERPGVLFAGVDQRFSYLWAPNDPYFPINAVSAGRYQWGMHAMNFPSAWDRTKGHGYLGAVEAGMRSQTHADLLANYRSHFSFVVYKPSNTLYEFLVPM